MSLRFRSRWYAGLFAVVVVAVPVVVTGPAATAAPTSQTQAARTVAVSESKDLPLTSASLTVSGTGFDPAVDVYLAVCAADTAPADSLTYCVGGEVPGDNNGPSWAVVTSEPSGKRNAWEFAADGAFSVDLTIEAAVGSSVDCVTDGCVLMVRSVGEQKTRPPDITIGLGFQAPPSSSTASSSSISTPTSDAPSTVGPDTVALPDAYAGQSQTVVFTGFTADEDVAVTVFSEPVTVPGIKASPGGVVAITFAITDVLVPGAHTVQAIGSQSGRIGLASFTVVPVPVTSQSPVSSSAESSVSVSAATSDSAPASAPPTAATTGVTAATSSADVVAVTPADSGRNLWWLWVTLILLVVVAGIIAAVAMSRRRAQLLEQERLDREQFLAAAEAAAAEPVRPPTPPRGYEPGDPGQSYGLLSGRQGDGPALYSGQGEPPTTRYEPPTQRIQAWPPFDEDEVDPAVTELRPTDE